MALSITIKPFRPAGGTFKGRKVKAVVFKPDASKPDAGYVVTSANLGLRLIEACIVGQDINNFAQWHASVDTAASTSVSTNQMTLQAFTTTGTGGSASSSVTGLSTNVVSALVIGF